MRVRYLLVSGQTINNFEGREIEFWFIGYNDFCSGLSDYTSKISSKQFGHLKRGEGGVRNWGKSLGVILRFFRILVSPFRSWGMKAMKYF